MIHVVHGQHFSSFFPIHITILSIIQFHFSNIDFPYIHFLPVIRFNKKNGEEEEQFYKDDKNYDKKLNFKVEKKNVQQTLKSAF